MRFLDSLLKAEREIQKRIDKAFGKGAARSPLELRREILDEIEAKIVAAPEGKIFPFAGITIHLRPGDDAMHQILHAAFVDGNSFPEDIRLMLEKSGCRSARSLEIGVDLREPLAEGLGRNSFDIGFTLPEQKPRKKKTRMPEVLLEVIQGSAEPGSFRGTRNRICLGRMKEVVDREGQIIRKNDLAFRDNEDEINSTVGRAHATIFFDEGKGDFRIVDESSRYGTRIFRENRSIEVPPGKSRGIKLRPGDEIHLGRACVRFQLP